MPLRDLSALAIESGTALAQERFLSCFPNPPDWRLSRRSHVIGHKHTIMAQSSWTGARDAIDMTWSMG